MSKVICEICGTAYPDTEKECPVCGFEKPETAEFAPEDMSDYVSAPSAPVKGGRFSKANVTKKNQSVAAAKPKRKKKKNRGSDVGLIIAIVLLLLAIICFSAHIYFTYFAQAKPSTQDTNPVATTTEPPLQTFPQQTEGTTVPEDLSCTGLTLYEQSVVLNHVGSEWLLNVVPTPANTTDEITYTSADQNVATVTADGKIMAVANGETVITVSCGDISVECKVICVIAEETEPEETEPEETEPEETEPEETEPEETEPEETEPKETDPADIGDFALNRTDFTLAVGESWQLYNGSIDADEISWRSSNSSVATVKNGRVKGIAKGYTWITAEYKGVKLKCIVYVQ